MGKRIGNGRTVPTSDPWIDRFVFPNGRSPSAQQIARAIDGVFPIEDWHNFVVDYDKTLMAWWHRFDQAWPTLKARYGDVFYKIRRYYLHLCSGFFRSRRGQLWQIVLTKPNRSGIYRSVR